MAPSGHVGRVAGVEVAFQQGPLLPAVFGVLPACLRDHDHPGVGLLRGQQGSDDPGRGADGEVADDQVAFGPRGVALEVAVQAFVEPRLVQLIVGF